MSILGSMVASKGKATSDRSSRAKLDLKLDKEVFQQSQFLLVVVMLIILDHY